MMIRSWGAYAKNPKKFSVTWYDQWEKKFCFELCLFGKLYTIKTKVEDLGITDKFSLWEKCLQEAICPCCSGKLVPVYGVERKCEDCNFVHANATPCRAPHATE